MATGVDYRQLKVTGCWNNPEDPGGNYVGRGVYYGASVSDASECAGEDVYIVGGANSAGQAAMFMAREAKSVTMLVRGPSLEASMSHYLIQQIAANDKISVRTCTEVVDTLGADDHLTGLVLQDTQSGERTTVHCTRMCCFIGAEPRTNWLDGVLARDNHGFILSGPDLRNVCGWMLDRPPHRGDQRAGCVRCRRRARRVSQAGGRRRRRGFDGGDAGASLSGRSLSRKGRPWAKMPTGRTADAVPLRGPERCTVADAVRERPHRRHRVRLGLPGR